MSLVVRTGEVNLGLLGPNGAGKTTSFYAMIVGLLRASNGDITIDGQSIDAAYAHPPPCAWGWATRRRKCRSFASSMSKNVRAVLEPQHDDAGQALAPAEIEHRLSAWLLTCAWTICATPGAGALRRRA